MPRIRLARVDELRVGQVRVVLVPEPRPPRISVLVTATGQGLRAYWNVCRHLPIPLDSGAGTLEPGPHLVCQTHGAAYEPLFGRCVKGPCVGEHLEPVALEVEDGVVYAVI